MTQTQKQNVPKLRFPGFRGEWKSKALRDFVDPKRKVTYGIVQPGVFVEEGIPLVRGGDYSNGWVPFEQIKRVTSEIDAPYKRSKLRKNDLLLTIVGANTGTIAEVPDWLDGANITQTTARIAVESGSADTGYILQCLKSHIGQNEVRKYIKGAAQPGLNLADVEKFQVPALTLPEQRKIAHFLSAVDEKIAHLSRKKALLEYYKKGCMQQLFSQKIRFTDDDGNEFPDWEEKRLGEVATRVRQKNEKLLVTDVLTNSAVQGIISQGDYFDHDIANADNIDRYTVVEFGDFVYNPRISTSAPVGPIKRNNLKTGVMSPLYDVFRFHEAENIKFWGQYYAATTWHKYMKQVANYGARHDRMAISSGDFFAMPLPYPHPAEQRKIADFLSALDRKIDLVAQELTHARSFKAGLLQQMFV